MIRSIAWTRVRARAFTIVVACALCSIVFADAGADATRTEANSTRTWNVTRATDPILDTPSIVATLPARPALGRASAGQSLHLSCTEGMVNVAIRWGVTVGREWTGREPGQAEVLVRFGENAPVWQHWRRTARRPVTQAKEPSKFMEQLGEHRTLALRVYPSEEPPITVVFDLTEAKRVIAEVTSACRASVEGMARLKAGLAELRRQVEAERKRIEAERKKAQAERRRIETARRRAAERALQEAIARDARRLEEERLALLDAGRTDYIAQIKAKIDRNWLRPPGTAAGLKCVVRVSQIPGGEVVQAEIQSSSGNVAFDRSVEEAVLRSSPLPVPKDPSLFDRNVVITFEPDV